MPDPALRQNEDWVDERADLVSECCAASVTVEYGAALSPDITFRCQECGAACDVESA